MPQERLRLVFNQVDDESPLDRTFATLLAYCATSGAVVPRPATTAARGSVDPAVVRG